MKNCSGSRHAALHNDRAADGGEDGDDDLDDLFPSSLVHDNRDLVIKVSLLLNFPVVQEFRSFWSSWQAKRAELERRR